MLNYRKIIVIIIFCVSVKSGNGQAPYYQTINDENGLPSNEVYKIVQDNKGYIWIGCDAGLYRYNGFEFKAYKHPNQNARSVSYLKFDEEQNLWCANFSGQIFVVSKDTLKLVADYSKSAGKYHFCFYEKAGFWKIDKKNLSLIDINGNIKKSYEIALNTDLLGNGTDMIFHENKLWLEIPKAGLYYFSEQKEDITLVYPVEKDKVVQNQRLFVFKNNLYLMRVEQNGRQLNNKFFLVNTQTKKANLICDFENKLQTRYYSFYEDNNNKLWISGSSGAICINNISEFSNPIISHFTNNKISSVWQDKEGNYWFSDLQNGIKIIPEMKTKLYNSIGLDSKNSMDITCLKALNQDLLMLGHYDGSLSIMNIKDHTITKLAISEKIKGITVKDIELNNEDIYISRGHLLKYNTRNKTAIYPEIFGNARDITIINDTIYSVHPEYVCRFSKYDIAQGKAIICDKFIPIGGRKIVYEKTNQTIYFALNSGLYSYRNGILDSLIYKNENIYVYTFASNNTSIWAATQTQGILEIRDHKIISTYLNNNELEDITAKAMCADENYVWACTNSNLIRIDIKNSNWKTFSGNIGINPRDVTSITKCGEEIFIGTKKCLIRIPANLSPENNHKPRLYIESISLNDTIFISKSNFTLDYNFYNLKFDFISFSYKSGKNFHYEYRLIGLDSTWMKSNYDSPFALYSSLPAGNYKFQVRSVNESNLKSDIEEVSFKVKRPVWQEEWFYALSALLIIFIVIALFRHQIKKIRKRNEAEKKLIISQLSALKAQMNPHFMYNALNSIQALILKQDIKNSNLYLSKFSNLMRKVLDASDKEWISLKEEIDILTLYLDLEKLRFGDEFRYSIKCKEHVDEYNIKIPAMILQPFVENALKHGLLHKKGEKKLDLLFSINNGCLRCLITDNGVGRKRAEEIKNRINHKHKSFATGAIDKRVELFNRYNSGKYKIEIIDLQNINGALGTEVIIEIPLN